MLTKLLRMLGEIDMSDLITAISGLAGALVGALITLHTSKSEAKEKLKQELAAQEEVISETQLEFRYKRLHDLYEMQEQCARIESGLRRVLSFSCEDTVQTYEENEIYPTISLDFLDNCKAILMTGSHDARLNALHVRLSIYNEAKNNAQLSKEKMRIILSEIHTCALEALGECKLNQNIPAQQISQEEAEILKTKAEEFKIYKKRILGKQN